MLGFYVLCIEETPLPNFWSISRNKFGLSFSVDKFSGYLFISYKCTATKPSKGFAVLLIVYRIS